jgi:hypothetical protein
MSVFQSQYTRALKVIPSDDANIPYPNVVISGTNGSVFLDSLIVLPPIDFIAANVAVGDIVYNITDQKAATVVEVVSENVLVLNSDAFTSLDAEFIIYNASPQTSNAPQGCYLYIGADGDVDVTTLGGDRVIFENLKAGTILYVQVIKVHSSASESASTNILALW